MVDYKLMLSIWLHILDFGEFCKHIVEFSNQFLHCWNELNQAFRDEHRTEVVAISSTVSHHLSDFSHDVVERLVVGFHLFADDAVVRLSLKRTFKSDVRSRAAHELDEVPVFLC